MVLVWGIEQGKQFLGKDEQFFNYLQFSSDGLMSGMLYMDNFWCIDPF
jgi:hypothetical protein